jgi:hypothetical protein
MLFFLQPPGNTVHSQSSIHSHQSWYSYICRHERNPWGSPDFGWGGLYKCLDNVKIFDESWFWRPLIKGTVSRDNLYSIFFIDHILLVLLQVL